MSNELLIFIGPLVGIIVGSLGTIITTWITKHYEEQLNYRKIVIDTSMEYFKESLIATREAIKGTGKRGYVWPYESFVISISHLVNRVVNKKFKIDEIDEIVCENKKLVLALEKLYSEKDSKN